MHFARPERPLLTQAPPSDRRTTSMGPSMAPPTRSASLNRSQTEMKALCRPAIPRPLKLKAESNQGGQTKKRANPSTNHHLATRLDQPDTFWRCPFCPVEYNTFLALKAHNNENHGGQLFRLECGQCGFQTDSPQLLRKHQARVHEAKGANTPGESVAAIPANGDAATTPTGTLGESAAAIPAIEDAAATPTSSASARVDDGARGLLCQETFKNDPITHGDEETGPPPNNSSGTQNKLGEDTPQINTPTQEPTEFITGITGPDTVFLGSALALWPEDELQDVEETEVTPIELEDDSSHVICPTCYDFLPLLNTQAQPGLSPSDEAPGDRK